MRVPSRATTSTTDEYLALDLEASMLRWEPAPWRAVQGAAWEALTKGTR